MYMAIQTLRVMHTVVDARFQGSTVARTLAAKSLHMDPRPSVLTTSTTSTADKQTPSVVLDT